MIRTSCRDFWQFSIVLLHSSVLRQVQRFSYVIKLWALLSWAGYHRYKVQLLPILWWWLFLSFCIYWNPYIINVWLPNFGRSRCEWCKARAVFGGFFFFGAAAGYGALKCGLPEVASVFLFSARDPPWSVLCNCYLKCVCGVFYDFGRRDTTKDVKAAGLFFRFRKTPDSCPLFRFPLITVLCRKTSGMARGFAPSSFLSIPLRKNFRISSALGYNARIVSEIPAFGDGINCSCEMAEALFLPAGRSPVSVKEL